MSAAGITSARAWFDRLDRSGHAMWLLLLASMAETLVVPIPIEVIRIPWMLLLRRVGLDAGLAGLSHRSGRGGRPTVRRPCVAGVRPDIAVCSDACRCSCSRCCCMPMSAVG